MKRQARQRARHFRLFVLVRLGELNRQFIDRTVETEGQLIVGIVNAGTRVDADVKGLVPRHERRDRMRNFLISDLGAVHFQDAGATFGHAGTIRGEIEDQCVLAR